MKQLNLEFYDIFECIGSDCSESAVDTGRLKLILTLPKFITTQKVHSVIVYGKVLQKTMENAISVLTTRANALF